MNKILVTGADSYVGENVRSYILKTASENFRIDSVDTRGDAWKVVDYSYYDVVFHVAGIAHVNADPKMAAQYYKVNRDLAIDVAKNAKAAGVKQFIFMSSQIVFHESQSLKAEMLTKDTKEHPNGFYGDSKLQAENGLRELECPSFKICILRPPMIYGPKSKGNFLRLAWLATKTPIFPLWHNKRSMLYIDNLGGTFYPQNKELADTVEIVRFFAKKYNHKIWFSRMFNPFVWLGSFVLQPLNKMFASYYYDPSMSKYEFDSQIISLHDSLRNIEIYEENKRFK